ncbi:hypothetical protein V8F20_001593 [Naviculisporaceae sp. PSN 640]
MSDPFANSVGSLGTASLLTHLNIAQVAIEEYITASPEVEVTSLREQIRDLSAITTSLNLLATRERRRPTARPDASSVSDLVHLHSVVGSATIIIEECTSFVRPLASSLRNIIHERDAIVYATSETRLGKQAWFSETLEALNVRTKILEILFSAMDLLYIKNDKDEDGNFSANAHSVSSVLHYQISLADQKLHSNSKHATTSIRNAIAAAKGVTMHVPVSTANKHFIVVRPSRTYYTGREGAMARLRAAFDDPTFSGQKRFVVYGLGGSGKTELALRYAENHINNFWGIFFVDGSSRKAATASYSEIATIGGAEPNEKAGKGWLATRDLPWLLIIDNVDDDQVQLDDLLPLAARGNILVTSRNPGLKVYGNVGDRYLELLPMEVEEANELILKAAEEPSPWTKVLKESANEICKSLGYLPLALIHAAKAILDGLCSWDGPTGYMVFHKRKKDQIRRDRLNRRDRSHSRSRRVLDEDNINVFASYELLYESLLKIGSEEQRFQDAVELLHVFSYFHFQNIRLDILINAAVVPLKESDLREADAKELEALLRKLSRTPRKSWSLCLRELAFALRRYLDTTPPLPSALRNVDGLSREAFEDEVHVRLGAALSVLLKKSLIMRQDKAEGRYSMHPLVHEWVRDRPEMPTSEQSLWCQVATTTLTKAIFLPPYGDSESDRSFRRELLPHIIHVRSCQAIIKRRLSDNRMFRKSLWPVREAKDTTGRFQADQSARFSRVYSECGLFNEALQLQRQTRAFLLQTLGEEHPVSIQLTFLLTGTLWELSRITEATDLQRRSLQLCLDTLGEDHPLTLSVLNLLGSALYMKGRWAEATRLLLRAFEKMTSLYGPDHERTLKVQRDLGRVYFRQMEYEKATEYHRIAWEGMKKRLGEHHLETLTSLEDYAMSFLRYEEAEPPDPERTKQRLLESHDHMELVLTQRRKQLGKEQPYTLLATLYLARVKSALGQHDVAERMMREGIPIGERNLGEDHTGVLSAKAHYARVLIQLGRYEEAEERLSVLAQKPQYRKTSDEDGDHPDRIAAMWFLVECLEKQGKFEQARGVCEEIVVALREIGGNGLGSKHKFASIVHRKIGKLEGMADSHLLD